jgi:MFS family permease
LTGYFLLGVGVAGFIFVPSSRIWGKRHAFILGTVLLIASSAWAGSVRKNYTSILWARIIQGVGCAPFEALVNASMGDLYFVHVRSFLLVARSKRRRRGAVGKPTQVWEERARRGGGREWRMEKNKRKKD